MYLLTFQYIAIVEKWYFSQLLQIHLYLLNNRIHDHTSKGHKRPLVWQYSTRNLNDSINLHSDLILGHSLQLGVQIVS